MVGELSTPLRERLELTANSIKRRATMVGKVAIKRIASLNIELNIN